METETSRGDTAVIEVADDDENEESKSLYKKFSSLIIDQINVPDVNVILDTQRQILVRLDATNRNLNETTQISTKSFQTTGLNDLQTYITILTTMKQDLDFIFKRIRVIKKKLETKYPEKYSNVRSQQGNIDEDEEDDETLSTDDLVTKERADSNESTSSALAGLIQTARNRISTLSGKDLVNGFLNTAQLTTNVNTNSETTTPYIEPPKQDDSLN